MLPCFLLHHDRQRGLAAEKDRLQVDVEDRVPLLFGDLMHLNHGSAEADAVDEDVQPAQAAHHVGHHPVHLRRVRGIGRHGHGLAALLPDGLDYPVEFRLHLLEIHQDDFCALTRKGVGNGFADAPGAADDDCYLVC